MKEQSSKLVLMEEFKKTKKDILNNLSEILSVNIESILISLSTFLIDQPNFIPPITAILNSFIKGYSSFKDFREFEMVISFIDASQNKSDSEKDKFINKIEDDSELIKKTIYYVSQQNDVLKSKLIGNIFKEYIKGEIDKEEFTQLMFLINDLNWFLLLDFFKIVDGILISDNHNNYFYSSSKKVAWECLDLKWSSLKGDLFGNNINKFVSSGLINERVIIQPIPKVLGNYVEGDQVKRLRESSQNVHIELSFTYESCLILRFGNIKDIDSKISFF